MARDDGSFLSELSRRNVWRVGFAYVIASWLILQVIDVIQPLIGMPLWASKLVLSALVLGFPLALVFAWAFEVTPDGLKRERDVDRTESIVHETGQRLDRITIAIAILAIGLMVFDRIVVHEPAEGIADGTQPAMAQAPAAATLQSTEAPSIAVLPFVNMSADESSAYFSDGLADTLLHMLAQIGEIRVASRTSSFRFRDPGADITEIASLLGVGNVLEGGVQRAGNRIRVTAQLIEADTGFHLWSGTFDRDLDDVFAIQDEIAREVVAALKVSLLGESAARLAHRETDSLEAYTEYLLGIDKLELGTIRSLDEAKAHFSRAIEIDPQYARARGMLGLVYLRMAEWGSASFQDMLPRVEDAAARALRIDENSAIAIAVMGAVELARQNPDVAESLLRRAIRLDPSATFARMMLARTLLLARNRPDDALRVLGEALAIDPLSTRLNIEMAFVHRHLFEYDEALRSVDRIEEIEPLSPVPHSLRAEIEYDRGNWSSAVDHAVRAFRSDPDDSELAIGVGDLFLDLLMPDAAERWYDRAAEINPDNPSSRRSPLLLDLFDGSVSAEGLRLAQELLDDDTENRVGILGFAIRVVWQYHVESGTAAEGLEFFRERMPEYFDGDTGEGEDIYGRYQARVRIADLMRRTGNVAAATELLRGDLDRGRQALISAPIMQMTHLQPLAAAGDRDTLLRALRLYNRDLKANRESPYLWPLRLRDTPLFDDIREEPEFIELVGALKRRAIDHRALLLEKHEGSYPVPEQ